MSNTILTASEALEHIKEIIEVTENDDVVLYEGMPLSDGDEIVIRRTKEGWIINTLFYTAARKRSGNR